MVRRPASTAAGTVVAKATGTRAVIGYYIDGYSYRELAMLLGVPISTIKGRLFFGRRQLQRRAAGKRNGPPVGLHTMRRHDVPDRISILAAECVEIGIGSLRRRGLGVRLR